MYEYDILYMSEPEGGIPLTWGIESDSPLTAEYLWERAEEKKIEKGWSRIVGIVAIEKRVVERPISETPKKTSRKTTPSWTVCYNIVSNWVGTGTEFFDKKEDAEKCFLAKTRGGEVGGTMRPFHKSDVRFMGAAHAALMKEEK